MGNEDRDDRNRSQTIEGRVETGRNSARDTRHGSHPFRITEQTHSPAANRRDRPLESLALAKVTSRAS